VAEGYVVFSQGPVTTPDIDAWDAHANRFFDTKLGLAEKARTTPSRVELSVIVAPFAGPPGIRSVFGRPREAADLAIADGAEAKAGGGGLAALAHRCPGVWIVGRESERDPIALLLAAVLASVSLGPVLDVEKTEIFGVKTARAKLAALG
jgi:hypothetical protein